MPNPSSATQYPALIEATTSQGTVEVDGSHFHEIIHHSVDVSGSAATTPIYFSFGAAGETLTVVASDAAGSNKLRLASGGRLTVKPGTSLIAFKTAAGSPIFSIIPQTRTLSA